MITQLIHSGANSIPRSKSMHDAKYASILTPIGKIGISVLNSKLESISWLSESSPLIEPDDQSTKYIASELSNYFMNPNYRFNVDMMLVGTPFQKRVWEALINIPPGQVMTYGELAKQLSTSPRAVGGACKANPIPIIVPCHRVVAMNSLGGFFGEQSGHMMDIKTWLLRHEGAKL
ncbi:unnamed protein product [Blepharisma stoltei]|uniref:Methylated-DNA--protein-cysteine methyltransferase n=1 Tax=Blepharisma stoltei TaxID=1481888 RepID=A0AAU9JS69_9CILI|nr:unnamed protein product [Blepharisma stoltei]